MNKYIGLLILSSMLLFSACSPNPVVVKGKDSSILKPKVCQNIDAVANLENIYWQLTVLNSKSISKITTQRREAYMVLLDGKIRGNSGCNRISGKYILDEDKLSLSENGFVMTRMFCQDSPEAEFIKALQNMHHYKITGENLEIFDKNGVNLAQFATKHRF